MNGAFVGLKCSYCGSGSDLRFSRHGVWICKPCTVKGYANAGFDALPPSQATVAKSIHEQVEKLSKQAKELALRVVDLAKATSQKARGVYSLMQAGFRVPTTGLIQRSTEGTVFHSVTENHFFRPCPSKPRHGFVNSRGLKTMEELDKLVAEIDATKEPVEILVMPKIDAACSGVWTKNRLSVGPGHDGATGNGKVYTLNLPSPVNAGLKAAVAPGKNEEIYFEVVWEPSGKGKALVKPWYVQARLGPKTPSTADYIPKAITVKQVVKLAHDYNWIAWEKQCEEMPIGGAGIVVYLPGAGLTCHAAIHAIFRKVPVITSFEPKVGQTIEPKEEIKAPRLDKVIEGFYASFRTPNYFVPAFGLAAVHAMPGVDFSDEHQAKTWGFCIGILVRTAFACSGGEYRYVSTYAKKCQPEWIKSHSGQHRNEVYEDVKNWSPRTLIAHAHYWHFAHGSKTSGVYSGPKWRDATDYAIQIVNLFQASAIDGTYLDWSTLGTTINTLAVCCHNGGQLFNKFHGSTDLNYCSKNPAEVFAPMLFAKPFAVPPQELATIRQHMEDGMLLGQAAIEQAKAKKKTMPEQEHAPHVSSNLPLLIVGPFQFRQVSPNGIRVQKHKAGGDHYEWNIGIAVDMTEKMKGVKPKAASMAGTNVKYWPCAAGSQLETKDGYVSKLTIEGMGVVYEKV